MDKTAETQVYIPLAPRCHRKSFRTASRFPMPTTHEQSDFAHSKFLVFCSLQPTKSSCSAAAEKCLSGVGQPLSSVSGRKRYNTLDFASKIVCQQGCCSPLLETQSQRGYAPLDTRLSMQWRSILLPHDGYAPARTGKTGTEVCPNSG